MASKRKRTAREWKGVMKNGFTATDFAWLAQKFRAQAVGGSEVTLETFATQHGVQPEWIRPFLETSQEVANTDTRQITDHLNFPSLSIQRAAQHHGVTEVVIRQWIHNGTIKAEWIGGGWLVDPHIDPPDQPHGTVNLEHGTTDKRAESIVEEGFKEEHDGQLRGVWFAKSPKFARHMAIRRAQQRNENPVVISCQIDLDQYDDFGRPNPSVYVFFTPIGNEVIRHVSGQIANWSKPKTQDGIDIIVTKTAGQLGVLAWVNGYLKLEGEPMVREDHPAIGTIWQWVDAQYAEGREDPISDEEMLGQVMAHLENTEMGRK